MGGREHKRCKEGALTNSFARSPFGVEPIDRTVEVVLHGGPVHSLRRRVDLARQPLPEAIEIATPTENGTVVLVYARRDQPGAATEYELTKHSMHTLTASGPTTPENAGPE